MTSAIMTDLDGLPLLAALSHTHRAALAGIAKREDYNPGTRLFEQGTPANLCWIVLKGCVVIDSDAPDHGRMAVQSIGPGELLGWSWLLPPYRWHFGATVVSPTTAVVIDASELRKLADADPALGYRLALILIDALLNRLQATRTRLLDLHGHPESH